MGDKILKLVFALKKKHTLGRLPFGKATFYCSWTKNYIFLYSLIKNVKGGLLKFKLYQFFQNVIRGRGE